MSTIGRSTLSSLFLSRSVSRPLFSALSISLFLSLSLSFSPSFSLTVYTFVSVSLPFFLPLPRARNPFFHPHLFSSSFNCFMLLKEVHACYCALFLILVGRIYDFLTRGTCQRRPEDLCSCVCMCPHVYMRSVCVCVCPHRSLSVCVCACECINVYSYVLQLCTPSTDRAYRVSPPFSAVVPLSP